MDVWKMIFLSNWVIFRFHVNFLGCKENQQKQPYHQRLPVCFVVQYESGVARLRDWTSKSVVILANLVEGTTGIAGSSEPNTVQLRQCGI